MHLASNMNERETTPELFVKTHERWSWLGAEAVEIVAGAAAGASLGIVAGPFAVLGGGVVGAIIGTLAGRESSIEEHEKAEHDKDLDAIGLDR